MAWQWQISGTVDQSVEAQMYDIDGFDSSSSLVAQLQAKGRKVVCYLDMGSAENYRPDYAEFPASALSTTNQEWPDEKWIHPASLDQVGPTGKSVRQLLTARIDMVHGKGCDAVEGDMVEAAWNNVSFPFMPRATVAEQLAFNRWMADTIHARGMAAVLKGARDGAEALEPWFDATIQEELFRYGEVEQVRSFVDAGKAVFAAEYQALRPAWCTEAKRLRLSLIGKKLSLGAWRETCP